MMNYFSRAVLSALFGANSKTMVLLLWPGAKAPGQKPSRDQSKYKTIPNVQNILTLIRDLQMVLAIACQFCLQWTRVSKSTNEMTSTYTRLANVCYQTCFNERRTDTCGSCQYRGISEILHLWIETITFVSAVLSNVLRSSSVIKEGFCELTLFPNVNAPSAVII